MGPDLLSGVDRRRPAWIHRYFGGFCRRCPLPVLCLRGDLPGAPDPRADDIQGVATRQPCRGFNPPGWPARSGHFLDLDLVRIERQVPGDLGHRREGPLIGPDRVFDAFAVGIDAEIVRIPLVGTVRGPLGAGQERHVGVLARHILHCRIAGFLERQRMGGVGDDNAVHRDPDTPGVCRNRDRMVGTGQFHWFWPLFWSARNDRARPDLAVSNASPRNIVTPGVT